MLSTLLVVATAFLPYLSTALPNNVAHNTEDPSYTFVPPHLNITTLAGNGRNESAIECWTVAELTVSSTPGTQGALVASLGNPTASSYINIPAQFDGGLHNAPAIQFVWFTSGTAVISLPASNDTAIVQGGANGLILAADVAAVSAKGHITRYPSKERTVTLVLPLSNNTVPVHTVLHAGACTEADGLGYLDVQRD